MDNTSDHRLPGFLGFVDDLSGRISALGDEDSAPLEWTPEHVGARMVEAFDVLIRSGLTVGPRQYGNAWPAMLKEFSDLVDRDAERNRAEEFMASRNRPTSIEVSRMNEALLWPFHHLDGRALASDSLMLWAFATASGRDMARMLHHRKKCATALAAEMERRANRLPYGTGDKGEGDCRSLADQWRAALRRVLAEEVAALCNQALATSPRDRHAAICKEAQETFRDRCKAAGCLPLSIKPHHAVPGRALSRTTLDRQRKIAMAAIADGLRRSGVAVR